MSKALSVQRNNFLKLIYFILDHNYLPLTSPGDWITSWNGSAWLASNLLKLQIYQYTDKFNLALYPNFDVMMWSIANSERLKVNTEQFVCLSKVTFIKCCQNTPPPLCNTLKLASKSVKAEAVRFSQLFWSSPLLFFPLLITPQEHYKEFETGSVV